MLVSLIDKYEDFVETYKNFFTAWKRDPEDQRKNLIVLFTGNDDPTTGRSWCPDCILAKPIIEKVKEEFQRNERISLAIVQVGHRDEWKRPDNPYRLHELKVKCIPTLVSLGSNLRLDGSECSDQEKVFHLFSNSI